MNRKKQTVKQWLHNHKPSKRRIIQLYAALLTNANLKGFKSGQIYQGNIKAVCAPGLNCYSCPAASASCPLGALQNALAGSNERLPYYILGILLLFGILFGRWICGFLCPFGLIQELLHKIKTPKIRKSRSTRILSYLKYVITAVFVVIFPLVYAARAFPLPAFCKYICPSGTLMGAGGLLANENNSYLYSTLGGLFSWKVCLLIIFLLGSVFMYRFFCRFFCPLGVLYGLFNRISLLGIKLEKPKCVHCGLCVSVCEMDIRQVGDHECISCGKCISVCPTQAISYKGSKILLTPNDTGIPFPNTNDRRNRERRKSKIIRWTIRISLLLLLTTALFYYNFIDRPLSNPKPSSAYSTDGNQIGSVCKDMELSLYSSDETIRVSDFRGKVTILNFWYTECGPCIKELQTEFPKIKQEYGDLIEILAIHSNVEYREDTESFIYENFPDVGFIFCRDMENEAFYKSLGGSQTWPVTVIVDSNGVIVSKIFGSTTCEELKQLIDPLLLN